MSTSATTVGTVAEAYLAALVDSGVRHVFANAGTDFAPIIEALVRAGQAGRALPRFITVPHENVAMGMAQGYYKVTGEPAAVMVHVTVGTANALCGLMNAARDNTPLLLAAGRTPVTEAGNAGSRNVAIHWGQEAFDQGGSVREYVKWDYELRAGQPAETVVRRALDIAMTEPRGPVYLTLPREVLGGEAGSIEDVGRGRGLGAERSAPAPAAVERVADMIAAAENPLIITGRIGNAPAALSALAELAEAFAVPVTQGMHANLASGHPMNFGASPGPFLDTADLVVVLDAPVPWIPRFAEPNDTAKLVHIGPDPMYGRLPFRGFEMDLSVAGSAVEALPLLRDALAARARKSAAVIDTRRKRLAERRTAMLERRAKTLDDAREQVPIHPAWVAHCLNQVKGRTALLVNELGVPVDFLDFDAPGGYLAGANAGGLGTGLGEALGAKLAAPERQVIAAVGDGSYMFGNPTAAHYVGRAESLPTLTMIMNNHMWFAVRRATLGMYPDGSAAKANTMPLTELTPSPDFERVIESCGGVGEKVEAPGALLPAMERALDVVGGGTQALLNIVTQPGGRD